MTSRLQDPTTDRYSRLSLQIIDRPIAELKLDPNPLRLHSKKQIRQIAASIREFGLVTPVVIDRVDNVVIGNGRILGCRELGRLTVPTLCADHLNDAQIRALKIADNRLAELAIWDDRALAEELRALSRLDLDFNLEITGFEIGEIDMRIASLDGTPAADDPAEADLAPAANPVSKPGDLWSLGEHRVLCGSVLDLPAVQSLMGEERATMVFTDPPYNVPIEGHVSGLGGIHHRSFAMASGEMTQPGCGCRWMGPAVIIARDGRSLLLHRGVTAWFRRVRLVWLAHAAAGQPF